MLKTGNTSFARWLTLLAVAAMLVLGACGQTGKNAPEVAGTEQNETQSETQNAGESTNGQAGEGQEAPAEEEESAQATVYPLTVTDGTGTELTFEQAPEKIVTLAPSETEILYAIGAGDRVVGVDEFSNYPEEALDKPKIGDMTTNIEAVAALNPDLVVASSGMNGQAIEQLRKLDLKVYATDPKTYDEVIAKIEQIGEIVDAQEQAGEVAAHMREVKEQVAEAVKDAPRPKVYLEFSPGWSVGKGEFLDELLTIAGGVNVAGDQPGWFEITPESVVQQNPEIIIYPDLNVEPNPILEGIESRPGWDVIDAVKHDRLYEVPQDPLVRVGPRLADGLLELAKAIHPDLFS